MKFAIPLVFCVTVLAALPAHAACPERIRVTRGDVSFAAIARTCGINVEALKAVNPGATGDVAKEGAVLLIPREAISSPSFEIGPAYGRITSPQVPMAPGVSGSTVILPPAQPAVPPQHILRGFGDQPGQLPLPEGHSPPTFGGPFIPQPN